MSGLSKRSPALNQHPVRESSLAGVTVVIPALNEESSLPHVLADLPPVGRVIVVDNGSTDSTGIVATACGAQVVSESKRGYGSACLRGLAEVRRLVEAENSAPEILVFIDADYSDHPDLLPVLVAPIMRNEADFVLGSRLLGERESGAMPPQSVYGNRLACVLMRRLFGASYTDLGPFRAIRYRSLLEIGMTDTNFGWTVEMQIKASRNRLRIQEVPVPYRRRIGTSKISGTLGGTLRAGAKILYLIGKYGCRSSSSKGHTTANREDGA